MLFLFQIIQIFYQTISHFIYGLVGNETTAYKMTKKLLLKYLVSPGAILNDFPSFRAGRTINYINNKEILRRNHVESTLVRNLLPLFDYVFPHIRLIPPLNEII